ncbi:hypothetical protein VP01_1460g2 [Puccinia sorghi]|uniref:Uncharacterized protein n=1 Tax=Puccinia sorghi TaxID=27349 RepID=A0A0L6VJZ6_9BASI|nr:hypothetical protein VP01_1460g2 [Puccinia sorghi]
MFYFHCQEELDLLDHLKTVNPEKILIQYNSRPMDWGLRPKYLNMNLGKEEAVTSTQHLVSSLHPSRGEILIYTDGLFDKEKGGSGAAICPDLDLDLSSALGIDPYILNHKCKAAYILTDNKGVLQCLLDPKTEKTGQYLFLEICEGWKGIYGIIDVTLVWCPEHQGIVGNEATYITNSSLKIRSLDINTSRTSPSPTLLSSTRQKEGLICLPFGFTAENF